MDLRLVNHQGRAALLVADRLADLERVSGGKLPADPMEALAVWSEVAAWVAGADEGVAEEPADEAALGPCVPRPAKVFALGLNYRRHAEEGGMPLPPAPLVFTKFPSCLAGPRADLPLPSATVDWEVELVAVIGRAGRDISEGDALHHVAGYCVGQDYSDRVVQMQGTPPQFSLGKSFDAFGPIGPAVVALDAISDPHDLRLWCQVNGETMQDDRTSDLIFGVAETVAYLSRICPLEPGDLIFTGTPSGVGVSRKPPRFLQEGDVVTSGIDGLGTLENLVVAP